MSEFDLFEADMVDDEDVGEDVVDEDGNEVLGEREQSFEEGGAAAKRRRADEDEDKEAEEEEYKRVASFQHLGLVGSRKLIQAQDYDKKLSQVAASLDVSEGDRDNILEKIASRTDIRIEYKNPAALILGYIMLIKVLRDERVTKIPKFREELQKEKFLELSNPIIKTVAQEYFRGILKKYFDNQSYKEILSGVDARDIIRYFELLRKLPLRL